MKATVLYHSRTGNTKKMAEVILLGMNSIKGIEAKAFSIEAFDENWVRESKCIIIGTPIYMANISGQLKMWLDTSAPKYGFAGKLGGAFATANYIHGGGDLGIRTILDHMMVLGMLTYSGGGASGVPVIHLGPVAIGEHLEESEPTFITYGKRMAKKTFELWSPQPY